MHAYYISRKIILFIIYWKTLLLFALDRELSKNDV